MKTNDASTALIPGGTSGIGRATANKLAELGIHVLVVGRNVERGEKTVAVIRSEERRIRMKIQNRQLMWHGVLLFLLGLITGLLEQRFTNTWRVS